MNKANPSIIILAGRGRAAVGLQTPALMYCLGSRDDVCDSELKGCSVGAASSSAAVFSGQEPVAVQRLGEADGNDMAQKQQHVLD